MSVIVPFRNPGRHFRPALESLAAQECAEPWEVVLVDNGSTDGSRGLAESFASRLPLRVVDARNRAGAAYGRNTGARVAEGDKLIFIDADDEVAPGYVAALAGALDSHDIVTSLVDSVSLNPEWTHEAHGPAWQQDSIGTYFDFLPAAGSNIGILRELFEVVGGFPEDCMVSEDIALSWRVQLEAGKQLHLVREAIYRYRYRDSVMGLFRQSRGYGVSTVLLYARFRGQGMPPRSLGDARAAWLDALTGLLRARARRDAAPYAVKLGHCVGRLVGMLRYRVVYL